MMNKLMRVGKYRANSRFFYRFLQSKSNKTVPGENLEKLQENVDEVSEKYSALADRFSQILDNKLTNSSSSMINTDPTLNKLFNEYNNNISIDSKASSYLKSESVLKGNRHAKIIYESEPWKGKESIVDANLRMILDSKPPIKKLPKRNLADVKDSALDYQLNDKSFPKDNFRELYKEKLLGPSMLNSPSSSVDLVGGLAASKINAAIDQTTGTFNTPEMENVRGKPLSMDYLRNCTDSNYFMNSILTNQEVLPPWVESQQNLSTQIAQFKLDIDSIWFNWILNKSSLSNLIHTKNSSTVDVLKKFESQFNSSFIHKLPDSDLNYINERILSINSSIRTYNLQSPALHLHKFKLVPQNEIAQSYLRTINLFPSKFVEWSEKNRANKSSTQVLVRDKSSGGLLNLWGGGEGGSSSNGNTTIEVPIRKMDNKLHVWKALKSIFAK